MASRLSGPSAESGSGDPNRNKNEGKRPRRSPHNVSAAPACGGHNQGQNAPSKSLNKQYSNSGGGLLKQLAMTLKMVNALLQIM